MLNIDQTVWDEFVVKRLTPEQEALRKVQQQRRAKNTNLYKLGIIGYVGLVQKLEKELGHELTELKRGDLWKRAQLDEEREYINVEVKEIAKKI